MNIWLQRSLWMRKGAILFEMNPPPELTAEQIERVKQLQEAMIEGALLVNRLHNGRWIDSRRVWPKIWHMMFKGAKP